MPESKEDEGSKSYEGGSQFKNSRPIGLSRVVAQGWCPRQLRFAVSTPQCLGTSLCLLMVGDKSGMAAWKPIAPSSGGIG